jgi:predicted ATPase
MSEAVCIPSDKVLDLLTALVDASLVVYEEQPDGTGRYRLLETTRQYAREKLKETGEEAEIQKRHLHHFLWTEEPADYSNLRAALWTQ